MKRFLPQGLCMAALVFTLATAPLGALAATDSGSLDITAQVGPVLSITVFPPANPLVDEIGDINVGTVTMISNSNTGFTLNVANVNAASELEESGGTGDTIPYVYYLDFFYGALGVDAPAGPFAFGSATAALSGGADIDFKTNVVTSTNVTYGVQLVLDAITTQPDGVYIDTLLFTLTD